MGPYKRTFFPSPRDPLHRLAHVRPDQCLGHEYQYLGFQWRHSKRKTLRYNCRHCGKGLEVIE